jgi:hypothetical protein
MFVARYVGSHTIFFRDVNPRGGQVEPPKGRDLTNQIFRGPAGLDV